MTILVLFQPSGTARPAAAAHFSALVQRFLASDAPPAVHVRALRHLEAQNDHFGSRAAMDVWTESNAAGFRYEVVSEEGSGYIRSHVLRAALETERAMWNPASASRAAFTLDNYVFEERGAQADGLTSLGLKPRRKDVLLIDGVVFLNPDDGELVRLEGKLAKSPSFWTRHVQITRWYRRFGGVRMPVAVESVANLRIAGRSSFRMTYEYESINGERVGAPRATAALK